MLGHHVGEHGFAGVRGEPRAGFGLELPNGVVMLIAMGFMLAVMAVKLRGGQ